MLGKADDLQIKQSRMMCNFSQSQTKKIYLKPGQAALDDWWMTVLKVSQVRWLTGNVTKSYFLFQLYSVTWWNANQTEYQGFRNWNWAIFTLELSMRDKTVLSDSVSNMLRERRGQRQLHQSSKTALEEGIHMKITQHFLVILKKLNENSARYHPNSK